MPYGAQDNDNEINVYGCYSRRPAPPPRNHRAAVGRGLKRARRRRERRNQREEVRTRVGGGARAERGVSAQRGGVGGGAGRRRVSGGRRGHPAPPLPSPLPPPPPPAFSPRHLPLEQRGGPGVVGLPCQALLSCPRAHGIPGGRPLQRMHNAGQVLRRGVGNGSAKIFVTEQCSVRQTRRISPSLTPSAQPRPAHPFPVSRSTFTAIHSSRPFRVFNKKLFVRDDLRRIFASRAPQEKLVEHAPLGGSHPSPYINPTNAPSMKRAQIVMSARRPYRGADGRRTCA